MSLKLCDTVSQITFETTQVTFASSKPRMRAVACSKVPLSVSEETNAGQGVVVVIVVGRILYNSR